MQRWYLSRWRWMCCILCLPRRCSISKSVLPRWTVFQWTSTSLWLARKRWMWQFWKRPGFNKSRHWQVDLTDFRYTGTVSKDVRKIHQLGYFGHAMQNAVKLLQWPKVKHFLLALMVFTKLMIDAMHFTCAFMASELKCNIVLMACFSIMNLESATGLIMLPVPVHFKSYFCRFPTSQ